MVKLYIESMKLKLKSQLEYRLSFILTFISQIGVFFTYYFMIVALFQRFDNIKGFTVYEVLLCFSIIHFGFAFNETFFRGVDKFDKFIIDGSLDRLLVRPRGVLYQVICSEMDFVKIARIIQSLIIFFIAISHLNIEWNIINILLIIAMFLSSIILFFGIAVILGLLLFKMFEKIEEKDTKTEQMPTYSIAFALILAYFAERLGVSG